MAKKTATYGGYELRVEDNGKIVILNAGQPVPNAMGTIRSIAAEVWFTLDPKWNTQSSGRKLVDFINSSAKANAPVGNSEKPASKAFDHQPETEQSAIPTVVEVRTTSASQPVADPEPAPTKKPNDTPANQDNENELTEEEMEELLKQIAELRKTIEALETRIGKLEKTDGSTSSMSTNQDKLTVDGSYNFSLSVRDYVDNGLLKFDRNAIKAAYDYNKRYYEEDRLIKELLDFISNVKRKYATNNFYYGISEYSGRVDDALTPYNNILSRTLILLSDGTMYYKRYIGDDLNTLKPIAAVLGIDVPKGTRKDKLAAELVTKYGNGKTAVIGDKAVYANGSVYQLGSEINLRNILHTVKEAQEEIKKYYNISIPLEVNDSMGVKETLDAIKDFLGGLKRKVKAQSDAAQAEEFERVAKEVFKELGVEL